MMGLRSKARAGSWAALWLGILGAAPLVAQDLAGLDVEGRLGRLERLMSSGGLVQMAQELQESRAELSRLRGEIEVLGHQLEQAQKRQRDLYVDLDRRLRGLELAAAPAKAPAAPAPGDVSAADVAPPSTPATPATPSTPVSTDDDGAGKAAYVRALGVLREGRYAVAGQALREYLKRYPGSSYADNAQYWLAETSYVTRQFEAALAEFRKLLEAYPESPKRPDAKLKLGFIQYELKAWGEARATLEAVIEEFPSTTVASLARERLARMDREGR